MATVDIIYMMIYPLFEFLKPKISEKREKIEVLLVKKDVFLRQKWQIF